jgi:hypothetical protein
MPISVIYPPGSANSVLNSGNSPTIQSGNIVTRPATAANGSIFIAWDTKVIYSYVSGAWVQVATSSGIVTGGTNGTSLSGTNIVLGGSNLTNATSSIGLNSKNLNFTSHGGGLSIFMSDGGQGSYVMLVNTNAFSLNPYGAGGFDALISDGTFNYEFNIDNGVFTISNANPAGSGIQDAADYSANWTPLNYITKLYGDANYPTKSNTRNAANFGLTASLANVGTLVVPAGDGTFRVGCWLNIRNITGAAVVIIQVTYTDTSGFTKTKTFFQQGSAVSALSTVDDFNFPTMDMRVQAGTNVTVSTTVSGVGTINYEAGCTITNVLGF